MMQCSRCGFLNPAGVSMCGRCRAALGQSSSTGWRNPWLVGVLCLCAAVCVWTQVAGFKAISNGLRGFSLGGPRITDAVSNAPAPSTRELRMTDTFVPRLEKAEAQTGDVQISLSWDNINDIDLHCIAPCGDHIYFANRYSQDGGELDVDMNASPPFTTEPIENIFWPSGGAPPGRYVVVVDHFNNYGGTDPTSYTVRVLAKGQVTYYSGQISYGDYFHTVCEFTL